MISRSIISRCAAAALAVGLTFVLKSLIEALVGPGPPMLIYLPAVTLSAWLGGLASGLTAVVLSAIICSYAHIHPTGSLWIYAMNDRFRLAVFALEGTLLCTLMEMLHAARRRSEAMAREAKQYQEELSRREGQLRAILDNSPSIIFLKDRAGRYVLTNGRFELLNAMTSAQSVGKTDHEIFPREAAEAFRANDQRVFELGSALEIEEVLAHDDGPHTYLSTKFPVLDAAGAVYAVGGICTDITGRKQTEGALQASEQRFRTLSHCSPVGIFLADVDGRCTYTNPRCQEIYGFNGEEALGEGWSHFIHLEDRPWVMEQWSRSAPLGAEFSVEYRTMGPGGTIRWVRDRAAPLLSDAGELIGHVGTVEDVTERREAEEAVRRERDFAEGLIATAQAIVLVLDRHGRVVRVNPFLTRVTGHGPDEVRCQDWFAHYVPPGDRPRARDAFLQALAEEGGGQITYPIVTRDGRCREVEWANRVLKGVVSDPCVLAIGHDITALKEAQQRAVQAERLAAIGEMVAGLIHESRNALHRSQVCLEMLTLEVEDRPEALNLIARLQTAQDDLYRLFEDVRSYAAPIHLEVRSCDLAEIWREAWAHLAAPRRGRVDVLREETDGLNLHCAADPFRLEQVFRNILDNALNASAEPARIEIRCDRTDLDGQPALRVAVRDHGPGLDPEQRQRIFEPFFTTKTRGTGLGMAITKRIVEAHGGQIAVGAGGGPGAEIILTLPRGLP
jgi:PAS domain S-box-containing protein